MRAIYARTPELEERQVLEAGLKSSVGFTVRRSQIILMSSDESLTAKAISGRVGQSDQQVRNVIHAFNAKGVECLTPKSRARQDDQRAYNDQARERLREIIRHSPRQYGYESSLWTQEMLAEISYEKGLTESLVHKDTVSQTLKEMGIQWRRAKHWINSPDEHYERKKKRRDWLKAQAEQREDWWLFDQDECWFSRFKQPNLHAWAESSEKVRLVEQTPAYDEIEKALACFGAVHQETRQTYLYFCDGQPNSEQTWLFIMALLARARQEAICVVVLIWDNATWHKSKRLRGWIRSYNLAAKNMGQPRLLTFLLPRKSPWLNPIEPRWAHAKRKTCEPEDVLSALELKRRLAAHFDTEPFWDSQII